MVRHTRESGANARPGQAEKKSAAKPERIAKALARAGVASRREVERLIGLGKVAVNGRVLDTPAVLVQPGDIVTVDGKVVNEKEPTRIWRYHKPVGLLTSHRDPEGRPTVFEHLPEGLPRVISVGRLDINSEGLLLLTNDGDLARALELPSNGWPRVYRARALGHASQAKLDSLKDGVTVDGVRYGPIEAKLDKAQEKEGGPANLWITVTVTEGKNREVRKVLEAVGMKVNRLIRLAYGPFQLGTLEQGAAEEIGPRVIREQLEEFIDPESLPTGDRAAAPVALPARRLPGNAMADPRRKPSKVKALAEREQQAETARAGHTPRIEPNRPERPDRPERPFKPRPGGDRGNDRPGGRTFKPREGGDRPERAYKPRGDKPEGAGRSYPPRERAGGGDRPERSFKPRGDKPDGAGRSYPPRDRAAGGDRPERTFKPRGDKPEGAGRSYPPRDRASGGDRPERTFKPRGDKPGAGGEKRPYSRERASGGDRPERTFKPRDDKPWSDKPRSDKPGGGEKRPYSRDRSAGGARPEGAVGRIERSYKPRGDKPGGDKAAGGVKRGPRSDGPRSDGPRSDGPRAGFKPGGGGGKPGGAGRGPARPRPGASSGPRKPRG